MGSISASMDDGPSKEFTVNFSETLPFTPRVFLQAYTSTTVQGNVPVLVLTSVSTTGFKFKVWKQVGASGGMSPVVHYMVVKP